MMYNRSMRSVHSDVRLNPKVFKPTVGDTEKMQRSEDKPRTKQPSAIGECDGLVYSKEELFEELRQAEKDAEQGLLPEFDSVEEMLKSLGI